MVAMGYGEYDPIASNLDDAGRYQNRRVVIKVMSGGFGKSGTPDTRR
jgi:chemotaxis protein MotB